MPTKCTITGTVVAPDGAPVALAQIEFGSAKVRPMTPLTIAPESATATTDEAGALMVELYPGEYSVRAMKSGRQRYPTFSITVPEVASAVLADIIDLPPPVSLDAAGQAVQAAQHLRDEAAGFASDAEAAEFEAGEASGQAIDAAGVAVGAAGVATGKAGEAADSAAVALAAKNAVDLGALETAKTLTAADRVQTGLDRTAASGSAAAAAGQAGIAIANAEEAAAARDSSFNNAKADTSIAGARARVADGETFMVTSPTVDEALAYRRDSSTTETLLGSFPSGKYVLDRLNKKLSRLSGFIATIGRDVNGRAAIAIKPDGEVVMPNTPLFRVPGIRKTGLSNYLVELGRDVNGRVPFGISRNGNPIFKGLEIDMNILGGLAAVLQGALDPTKVVDCWGDSLTHGNTSGVTTPYPTALASMLPGRTVRNKGLSGRTSNQIATAFGGKPSLITVAGNTIPTSGPVSVTLTENGNFSSKSNFGTISVPCFVAGIRGTLAVGFNATDPNLPGTSTFTRTTAGAAALIPDRTPVTPVTDRWEFNTPVIWSGRNDVISGFTNDTILANIAAMVNYMGPLRKRFVILGVTDSIGEASDRYNQILALNYELACRYPANFIDIRKILVNSYNPALPTDVTAFNANKLPPSLSSDGLHLNNAGYLIVATAVYLFLLAKGW